MTDSVSSVSFFVPDTPKLTRNLRGKLSEERLKRIEQLVGAEDWPDFKQRLGAIRGLEIALKLCIETEQDLYGRH